MDKIRNKNGYKYFNILNFIDLIRNKNGYKTNKSK